MTGVVSSEKESLRSDWENFWEEKQDVEEVYSNADRILRSLRKVTTLGGARVLEIGAGTGRDSFPVAEAGADVYQLDYSSNSLLILKRLAEARSLATTVVGGDAFQLPFRDNTFDIVFHQGLLEHFRKPFAESLLREHVRVLRAGGLLLVDVPQRYHLYTIAKHILIAINKWFAGWERSFSLGELRDDLTAQGLTPVFAYGEWMYPSFFYRVIREMGKRIGIRLPLKPILIPGLTRLRASVRARLLETALPLHTGISIGVIARKSPSPGQSESSGLH
ncbi:MAG: methyltransferase domain-containing protein [Ignavibacteriales bacterium]|nr:methyltransferase domain-containing protein [Ignavibacteriales bacterium]